MFSPKILVRKNIDELSGQAAELFVEIANASIARGGIFSVALSGGSTPRVLYSLLASDRYRGRIPWDNVRFFFGDERNVPSDSPESNYAMAYQTLLGPLDIDPGHVFRWQTELRDVERIAILYADELEKSGPMDLVLLGLGTDGHTASLFPDTEAVNALHYLAIENWVPKLDAYRFTMTLTAIGEAANVMFLVTGEEKAAVVAGILEGDAELPARWAVPETGELYWLLDEPAASLLQGRDNLL